MSTYQLYDFVRDLNFHIMNHLPIELSNKSKIFKIYLFKLKIFQLSNQRIKMSHPMFKEDYFIYLLDNKVYVAKKLNNNNFQDVEVMKGMKFIRKIKLKKLFH